MKPASDDRQGLAFTSSTQGLPAAIDPEVDPSIAAEVESMPAGQ